MLLMSQCNSLFSPHPAVYGTNATLQLFGLIGNEAEFRHVAPGVLVRFKVPELRWQANKTTDTHTTPNNKTLRCFNLTEDIPFFFFTNSKITKEIDQQTGQCRQVTELQESSRHFKLPKTFSNKKQTKPCQIDQQT